MEVDENKIKAGQGIKRNTEVRSMDKENDSSSDDESNRKILRSVDQELKTKLIIKHKVLSKFDKAKDADDTTIL